MLGTLTALVAFAAKPRSLPVVDREAQLLHAAHARIEELESANSELTVERDAARDRVLEIGNAYCHAHGSIADLEERLARYEGRRPHPMSHLCCVPSRSDLLKGTRARPQG